MPIKRTQNPILALRRLRENRLPNLYPLLLLIRQPLLRFPECARENLPNPSTEDLQRQHGLPISDRESYPICIDRDNAGIHLPIR